MSLKDKGNIILNYSNNSNKYKYIVINFHVLFKYRNIRIPVFLFFSNSIWFMSIMKVFFIINLIIFI